MIQAFYNAKKHKTKKAYVYEFELSLGTNINALIEEIQGGYYNIQPYTTFDVYSPKQRTIYAPHFRDVVVQHAIHQVIYPIYNPMLIGQNYACRKGCGTHKAADRLQHCMRVCNPNSYYLQLDLRKFFYRIDHGILQNYLERKIKDRRMINLMMKFVPYGEPVGLPIGNLLSQLFASIYLDKLDHYVKEAMGVKHYIRYVDDFVLLGYTKSQCYDHMNTVEEFVKTIKMEFSNWKIRQIRDGIDFCGYRTWQNYRLIRKRSMYRCKKAAIKNDRKAVISLFGHAQNTASIRYLLETVARVNPVLLEYKPMCNYRQEKNYDWMVPIQKEERSVHRLHH
jgi:RNA-directed DNA polymerase